MSKFALYSNCFGSGKTTLSDYLVNKHGFTKVTLASGLKDHVHNILEKNKIYYDPNDKQSIIHQDKTLRDYYIHYGKKLCEERGPTWMIPDDWATMDRVVVDDLRRPEELEKLVEYGFTPVFVDRRLPTPDNPLEGLLEFDIKNHLYVPNLFNKKTLGTLGSRILLGCDTPDDQLVASVLKAHFNANIAKGKIVSEPFELRIKFRDTTITVLNDGTEFNLDNMLKLTNALYYIIPAIEMGLKVIEIEESEYSEGAAQLLNESEDE